MRKSPLSNLTIRSAVVRGPDIGSILACDLQKEESWIPHAYILEWQEGKFSKRTANFDAGSMCFITIPESALVFLAAAGYYGIHYKSGSQNGSQAGDVFEDSEPPPRRWGYIGFRSVSEIAGKAYAVGLRGMVYRLDTIKTWTRIDYGLPDTFDIEEIDGFSASDLYAVGYDGQAWRRYSEKWVQVDLPTNINLNTVKCARDGMVYIAGHGGILIRGKNATWKVLDHDKTDKDIWDLEWFNGELYVSTAKAVYRLRDERLELVDFGADAPSSCRQLSVANGIMWSIGEYDIMSFNGRTWSRIV